jgi:hypothetical protein
VAFPGRTNVELNVLDDGGLPSLSLDAHFRVLLPDSAVYCLNDNNRMEEGSL